MIFHGGYYYYSESRNKRHIWIRRSRTIAGIGQDPGVRVWSAPQRAPIPITFGPRNSISSTANGSSITPRTMATTRTTACGCLNRERRPRGQYRCRGRLETGGWAIDGTVMTLDDGRKYFIWSGWPGKRNGRQNIYIAPMQDPVTIAGPRALIASPTAMGTRRHAHLRRAAGLEAQRRYFHRLFGQRELDARLLPRTAPQQYRQTR